MAKDTSLKIPRSLFESDLWKKRRMFSEFEACVDMLFTPALDTSARSLAARWNWSKSNVQRFLKKVADARIIVVPNVSPKSTQTKQIGTQVGTLNGTPNGTQVGTPTELKNNEVTEVVGTQVGTLNGTPNGTQVGTVEVLPPTQSSPVDQRRYAFGQQVGQFLSKFPRQMLLDFYNYWSELNRSGTKMRFELQKTWELSRRIATWANNEKARNGNNNSNYQRRGRGETDEEFKERIFTRLANATPPTGDVADADAAELDRLLGPVQ